LIHYDNLPIFDPHYLFDKPEHSTNYEVILSFNLRRINIFSYSAILRYISSKHRKLFKTITIYSKTTREIQCTKLTHSRTRFSPIPPLLPAPSNQPTPPTTGANLPTVSPFSKKKMKGNNALRAKIQ
jgi:hypothetical protein